MRAAPICVLSIAAALTLLATGGCVIFSPNVDASGGGPSGPTEPAIGSPESNRRYTPYAKRLDSVLKRQRGVQKELGQRDWGDFGDELNHWRDEVVKLNDLADTTKAPAKMRQYCADLLGHIRAMQDAQQRKDAGTADQHLRAMRPILDQMGTEFPLTEPKPVQKSTSAPPSGAAGSSASSAAGGAPAQASDDTAGSSRPLINIPGRIRIDIGTESSDPNAPANPRPTAPPPAPPAR